MAVYMDKFILNLIWDSVSIYIMFQFHCCDKNPFKNNLEEEDLYLL